MSNEWAVQNTITKNIDDVVPYDSNPREHAPEQIEQVANSIKEFGWTMPILIDENNEIIAGHGRLLAGKSLGIKEVPCIVAKGWSDEKKKAYCIADNKLTENSTWSKDFLKLNFEFLIDNEFDLGLTGFSTDEIAKIVPDFMIEEGLTDEDEVPEIEDNPITKEGDIWILGEHRLMCGDSTNINHVEELMKGNRPDMVFTDPPYNIDYQGVKDKRDKIKNDSMSEDNFKEFLMQSLYSCEVMYVCCSWQYAHVFKQAMTDLGRKPKAMIVWNKVNPAQNLDKYYKQHELIFYYGDFGGHKTLRGDVWTLKRQKNVFHPTTKPVELIDLAIQDQSGKELILDPFLGSGSTMISAHKNNRICYGLELDPKYCDVIIKRWQNFTGKDAVLESTGELFNKLK